MSNSVPGFFIESDDDEEAAAAVVEEGKRRGGSGSGDGSGIDGSEGGSDSSSPCDSPRVVAAQCSQPSSYTQQWPQSYRQSIDIYSSVHSPNLSFLGTPTLSRLSNSFLTNSFQRKPPDIIKPLLSTSSAAADSDQQMHEDDRKSSRYLPPSRKASSPQGIPEDHRPLMGGHEMGPYRQCSYSQGVMNGVNVLCGVGILSTPYAVKEGGWFGLVILVVLGVLAWYTGILLRHCLDSKEDLETYPDIGHAAFGTAGRIATSIILYMELYACCIEYLILESDNLSKLFPNAHLTVGRLTLDSHVLFAIVTALVVMPTTWLRDLSCLSFISAGGVIASIVVVFCLFWVGFVDHVRIVKSEGSALNIHGIPIAIGLYGYCYSGHGVFPNIYSSLKKRNQFPAVLFTSIALSTVLLAGAAIVGYIMFGESTESQFTLNLPPYLVASNIAVWTTVTNPITKIILTWVHALSFTKTNICSYDHSTRLVSGGTASSNSTSIPEHSYAQISPGAIFPCCRSICSILRSLVMSLVGSFLTMFVVVLCVFIMLVGFCCAGFGTYSSISEIIQKY
ncbi:hypothetical protein ACP70R_012102 [Stipagrostis hirtigluma subsp. patula]